MSTTTNAMLQTLVFWKPRGWFGWNNKLYVRTLEHNLLNHSTCSINPLHTFFGWSEPSTYLICLQFHPSVSLMITWITEFLPSVNDNVSWTAGVDIGPMSHLLGTQIFQETWIQSPEAWVTPSLSSHQCGGCLLYLGPDFCRLTPKSHSHCSQPRFFVTIPDPRQHASSRTINLGFERSC